MRSKAAAVAAAMFVVAGAVALGPAAADPADPTGPSPGPAPGPSPAPAAGPATAIEADGHYAVGTDIAPGTYTSAGPVEDGTCYWKRSRDGKLLDNAMTKKPQVVRIEPTDTEFRTSGCQPWTLDNSAQAKTPLDAASAEARLRGDIGRLNLGSLLHGGGQVPGP